MWWIGASPLRQKSLFFFFPDSIHQVVLKVLYNLLVTKRKKEAQVVYSLWDSGRGQASILHWQHQRFILVDCLLNGEWSKLWLHHDHIHSWFSSCPRHWLLPWACIFAPHFSGCYRGYMKKVWDPVPSTKKF